MRWEPRRHLPLVAGLALLVAAVGLVAPWWTVERQAGATTTETVVSPFDTGSGGSAINEAGVFAVGVLAFVGVIGLVGGLVLGFQADNWETESWDAGGWLWLGSGGFLLVAPLTAVITWPAGTASFWGTSQFAGASFSASASWGWYVTLVAGAIAAVAGMAWLFLPRARSQEPS